MSRTPLIALTCCAAAALGAGCGSSSSSSSTTGAATTTTPPVTQATTSPTSTQASSDLSPQARDLLSRAQALAKSVASTGQAYATGSISPSVASHRFEGERVRAMGIAKEAQALPEADGARGRLAGLSTRLADATAKLRDQAKTGKAPDAATVLHAVQALAGG